MTDHSEQGDASSLQKSSSQSADGSPTSNSSREAALSQQQAALNSIFKKKNNGVQYGSMPLSGSGTSAAPLQNSTGSAKGQKASKAGSSGGFSRIASPQKGAVPKVGKKEAQAPEDKTRPAAAGNARPIILFDRVSKLYPAQPNKPALNNISMTIYSGEFVFLVGHSGSGKSTFIRLINHEFTTSSGRLYVAGEDLSSIRRWRVPYLRRNIGCVFQDFKLLPNKTAFQNVAFALQVIGKSKHIIRTQVPEVLRLVGLEDKTNKYPDQLSGGEQQRVSIARAIVNRPPMLICDEPTGNLDPQTSLGIMRLLDRINRTGTTILVATHDREMVDSMRKRVVALENGFLVRDEDKGVYGLDA
ncbi:MAG: cell division ATP-binding protein FtsE [Coriobacteriia bacterium]|nr:cell division ATP-binding protein FtsE [Coriobacteriia bacterium]